MTSAAARTGANPTAMAQAGVVLGSVAVLTTAVVAGRGAGIAAAATLVLSILIAAHRSLTRWHTLLGLIVFVILFIPIRRYKLGGGLPFDLEPYRIVVALVVTLWLSTLLIDRRFRLRGSFVDPPLMLFALAIVGSILMNISRIGDNGVSIVGGVPFAGGDLSGDVLKKTIFFASFYLVYYMVVSVVRDRRLVHALLKTLVGGSAVVALVGVVEARTNYNLFDHLSGVIPGLNFIGALNKANIARGGRLRVYASSEHPIALAALLVMMLPLAIYLARQTGRKRWALFAVVIGLGAISTVSRTSITMLVAVVLVFLWLRPVATKKLWPLLVPGALVIHLVLPGAIGGIQEAFFPSQGLVQDQTVYGGRISSERLRPEIERIKANPLFGQGFGTRLTAVAQRQNARVLDDEWLGTLSETGLVGLGAWLWFFARFIRRAGREAKRDFSERGWLLVSITSAVAAFAVGMATYDAFSFVQVTFVLFIISGIGACVMRLEPWSSERRRVARAPARLRRPPA